MGDLIEDTDFTEAIVCPYCGEKESDSWEVSMHMSDGEEAETSCGSCGKDFIVTVYITTRYSTKVMEKTSDAIK